MFGNICHQGNANQSVVNRSALYWSVKYVSQIVFIEISDNITPIIILLTWHYEKSTDSK